MEVETGLKQVENTIRRAFPNSTVDTGILNEKLNFSEQYPLRLGANLADELGGTVRPKDIRPFNLPTQKGLMDTIYPAIAIA